MNFVTPVRPLIVSKKAALKAALRHAKGANKTYTHSRLPQCRGPLCVFVPRKPQTSILKRFKCQAAISSVGLSPSRRCNRRAKTLCARLPEERWKEKQNAEPHIIRTH
jgi:hypothetical protein